VSQSSNIQKIDPWSVVQLLIDGHSAASLSLPMRFLDVRSEGEYDAGHFDGFLCAPILNNIERAAVGTTFKSFGQQAAIELGVKFTEQKRKAIASEWHQSPHMKSYIVMCFRGGLRSKYACEWLSELCSVDQRVYQVEGGYKSVRTNLLRELENKKVAVILSGLTGSGKSRLLRDCNLPSLDLERLANHRGSAFGELIGGQPTQVQFENNLAVEWIKLGSNKFVAEDESRLIGRRVLPVGVKETLESAEIIEVVVPFESRIRNIFDEYVKEPLENEYSLENLCELRLKQLTSVSKKLGGAEFAHISTLLETAFKDGAEFEPHAQWISRLLKNYYDPMYKFSSERRSRKVIFRGDYQECLEWMNKKSDLLKSPKKAAVLQNYPPEF